MPVIPISGRDSASEARALLNFMLRHGDIAGTDHAGRTIVQLAVEPWTLDRTFDADAADLEDTDGEPEPDLEINGPAAVLDLVPPKQIHRSLRAARAVALALLLLAIPQSDGVRAGQTPMTAPLPMSTAQEPAQCCRVCRKGQACGDGCISAEKQCKKDQGCACSAASGS